MEYDFTNFWNYLNSPFFNGIIGACVGGLIVARQVIANRKFEFQKEQLSKFYAPLCGMIKKIKTHTNLRIKIQSTAGQSWTEECKPLKIGEEIDSKKKKQYMDIIYLENKKLEEIYLPKYRQILNHIYSNYHLSDAKTRELLSDLEDFVDIWEREKDNSLPQKVLEKIDHNEEKVEPLYQYLEEKMNSLQGELGLKKSIWFCRKFFKP